MSDIEETEDIDDFVIIEKNKSGGIKHNPDTVYIREQYAVFGHDVSRKLLLQGQYAHIEYSPKYKALRITGTKDAAHNYKMNLNSHKLASLNIPAALEQLHVARGTYRPFEGHPDTYRLVTISKSNKLKENINVTN